MSFDTSDKIEVTDADLKLLVKTAYNLSRPQGMGFLHFKPDPLTDDEAEQLISKDVESRIPISLDYVKGRACKFHVYRNEGRLWIQNRWYDHSAGDLIELLQICGVKQSEVA